MKPMQIGKTVYKVADFLSWQRSGSLELSPHFQRRPVWPLDAKSYLIDTIVRGLPIPIIFLRERTDLKTLEPRREVVDGQQRLRTLFAFIEPAVLKDYDEHRDPFTVKDTHNHEIAAKSFRQLPREFQQQILNYEFSVHILSADTDDRDVLQIFARLNSTGVRVNPQEIRNAIFIGVFKTAMYDLAYEQLHRWRDWGVFDERDIARMMEVEMTSELTLLMLRGLQGKSQRALDNLYRDKEDVFQERREVTRRFRSVMDQIDDLVGLQMKTLVFSRQALFHTLFTFIYDLMFGLGSPLKTVRHRPLPASLATRLRSASDQIEHEDLPDELAKALRGAVAHVGTRTTRLKFLRQACRVSGKA